VAVRKKRASRERNPTPGAKKRIWLKGMREDVGGLEKASPGARLAQKKKKSTVVVNNWKGGEKPIGKVLATRDHPTIKKKKGGAFFLRYKRKEKRGGLGKNRKVSSKKAKTTT